MNQQPPNTTETPGPLSLDVTDGIATLTMARAKQRNPFTQEFKDQIADLLRDIQNRNEIDVLILTGTDGIFSAGGDVKGMGVRAKGEAPPPDYDRRRIYALHDWLQMLRNIEIPTIAAVDGPAYGGGFGLALCCDFILATPRAKFCSVFGRIGLVPDCSVFFTLPRMVGAQRAKEIMFTARAVEASEAMALGIVLELHEPDDLMAAARALAKRMQKGSRTALGATKRIANQAFDVDANALIEMEASAQAVCLASDYHKDAAIRFSEKRPLLFNWEQFDKDDA
ncbi:MAG: 2-(1,2-epoxy-1,2-dihydrophenyl)acetyl-CoA isomerase [Hyphomicrobiaceae bacterium]|jgi:2-(1,2-epoxy-1,2-dihydrophenyl)acetyl-CoA isomerase